jgi:hypothetical protein
MHFIQTEIFDGHRAHYPPDSGIAEKSALTGYEYKGCS